MVINHYRVSVGSTSNATLVVHAVCFCMVNIHIRLGLWACMRIFVSIFSPGIGIGIIYVSNMHPADTRL